MWSGRGDLKNINNITTDKAQDIFPNQTLYVNGLNEKIKTEELKQNLYHLFSQYGDILEIHARKTFKMKGQAFIVFREIGSSTNAKHSLNGALIFGNKIKVDYSKSSSDVILKGSGQYSQKDKAKKDLERRKKKRSRIFRN